MCLRTDEGRNTTGTCGAELCSCTRGGDSGPDEGGDSGLTTVRHASVSTDKGRNLPGSSGVELLFRYPRAETPAVPGGDSAPPEVFSRELKAEILVRKGCNGRIFGRAYINEPFLPGGVSWPAYPFWISLLSLLH